jgi:peptidoglycan/xylan/chitin deacetylase (PgdA/CDA1 family)
MPESRAVVTAVLLFMILAAAAPGSASREATLPDKPSGCSANAGGIEIHVRPAWGVVPYEAVLGISLTGGPDSIEAVHWDFESDGDVDTVGVEVRHVFTEPVDHVVSALVSTRLRGCVSLYALVRGYNAVMSLTFDDGCVTVYTNALPLLNSKEVTATSYMEWLEVKQLHAAGWDIGSHTMTHISLPGADDSTLRYELLQSRIELESRGFPCDNFALPHGAYDDRVMAAIRMYYSSCRTSEPELNPPPECADPYHLKAKTGQPWLTLGAYKADIDSVVATRGWYILNNHRLMNDCHGCGWCMNVETLAGLLDYALARRVRVASIREALEYRDDRLAVEGELRRPARPSARQEAAVWAFTNPLRVPASIELDLPSPAAVSACVYDCAGRRVRELAGSPEKARRHVLAWDGLNSDGEPVASGVYYCLVTAGDGTHSSGPILILR